MRTVSNAIGGPRKRLETWGEIASHLGVEIRTAQRWEKRLSLPVRRLEGSQAVFAFADELDAWLAAREVRPAATEPDATSAVGASAVPAATPVTIQKRPWLVWPLVPRAARLAALTAAAMSVTALAFFVARALPQREPTRLVLERHGVLAVDSLDRVAWRYEFKRPAKPIHSDNRPDLASWWERMDADGDGVDELMAVVHHPEGGDDLTETLYCFTLTGQLKYSFTPNSIMRFRERSFAGPWMFWDLEPVPEDQSVWVSFVHAPWWASGVYRIDGSGRATVQYAQPGLVRTLRSLRRNGKVSVLAGGVNNEYGAATLAVLDPFSAPSAAPQVGSGAYTCLNCPLDRPLKYLVFPPSPLSVADGRPYNEVFRVSFSAHEIGVSTFETELARVWYQLTPDFKIRSATPSDGYWTWKPMVDANWLGRLRHPQTLTIRTWSAGSWSEEEVRLSGLQPD